MIAKEEQEFMWHSVIDLLSSAIASTLHGTRYIPSLAENNYTVIATENT